MQKISFFGLSGSGKSCYIYAMSHAMMEGVRFDDNSILNVNCTKPFQMVKLHREYVNMENGHWPKGSIETTTYDYSSHWKLKKVMDFQLEDYRGALLMPGTEDEDEEHEELMESFLGSSTLLFFVGADIVLKAMNGDFEADFNLGYLSQLFLSFRERTNEESIPVMVVISKADMIADGKQNEVKAYVTNKLQGLFGAGTGLTVGITLVSLGRNLSDDCGELEGELIVRPTSGNIHIPVFFSLFGVITKRLEQISDRLKSAENAEQSGRGNLDREMRRSAFARFFSSNERSIRAAIEDAEQTISTEKANMLYCADVLAKIKGVLMQGADLYVDGVKLN